MNDLSSAPLAQTPVPVLTPPATALSILAVAEALQPDLNRPGFTGGQNSRRIARYGTDTKEEDLEAVFI